MKNVLEIEGQKAIVTYDAEIGLFRGEFIGLSGGADFYSDNVKGLKREGKISLGVYLDMCRRKNIEPFRSYSGKFNIRLAPTLHEAAATAAAASGESLNEWVARAIERATAE